MNQNNQNTNTTSQMSTNVDMMTQNVAPVATAKPEQTSGR